MEKRINQLSTKDIRIFRNIIRAYYKQHQRILPWRRTHNPYKVLISEIMLQQTQADRVVPKYQQFLKQFPNFTALASAPLGSVLVAWQGLGYNRRAKMLHMLAQVVTAKHKGRLPNGREGLLRLPGIGNATAAAIRAFAFNLPDVYLETNVRSVYLHYFFKGKTNVPDSDLLPLIEQTMDKGNPREWNWALLDYGVMIKKQFGNPNKASRQYTKQSKFSGSFRQVRGAVLRAASSGLGLTMRNLSSRLPYEAEELNRALNALTCEGLLVVKRGKILLP